MEMISIIVPTSSRAKECSSFIKNIYKTRDVEIIIIENGSSLKEKKEYSELLLPFLSNVKLIFSFEKGASNARNFGASIASSKWVWFIDDDDFVSQSTINDCIHACSNNLDIIMVPFKLSSNIDRVYSYSYITATYKHIRRFGHIGNANILIIKKTFFNNLKGWDGKLKCGQDTDLFLRIFKNNPKLHLLNTTPVEINDDDRDRITLNAKIQMIGKVTFIKKHWRNLHYLRLFRYVLSFVIAWPLLKKMYFKIRKIYFSQIAS
jgi:glycosyltransferase involved in cell wall biosynthesis